MWQWFKEHTGWLAIGFGAVALLLAVVVAIQVELLYDGGSRLVLGTVPEWLSGIGAFATFAVVWIAVQQLATAQKERMSVERERKALAETREAEREDRDMSQARLIIVASPSGLPVIANHSSAPIFNLEVEGISPVDPGVTLANASDHHAGIGARVLKPGETTDAIRVMFYGDSNKTRDQTIAQFNYVSFTFTDARGSRWRRTGSEQPIKLLNEKP